VPYLRRLAGKAPKLYRCWDEAKKNGGKRRIEAPHPNLKIVQRKLAVSLLDQIPVDQSLHGKPGTSQMSAARLHVHQHTVMTMDLSDFFPSVTSRSLMRVLKRNGFSEEVADLVCRLCTHRKRLPQGAPTSPVLARIVVSAAAKRIRSATGTASPAVRVTQYVDDLAISGPQGIERFENLIRKIYEQDGLRINSQKTRVMRGSETKEVLGLKVNERLEISDSFAKELANARQTMARTDRRLLGKEAWKRRVERSN